jgi:type I restriction enzyme R subunit
MDPSLLYAPFTDIASTGPEQVFDDANVAQLVSVIRRLNDSAAA